MRRTDRLDRYLPIRFTQGGLIRQFSKPCVKCGQMLHAQNMQGIARLIDNHLVIAARAECTACQTVFPVCCVVNSEKQVRRLVLPVWLFLMYLRFLPEQPGERLAQAAAVAQLAEEVNRQAAPAPRIDYPRADTTLGQYQGKTIPAHIIVDGREIPFDRIEPDGRVKQGEYLLDDHFVYKPV